MRVAKAVRCCYAAFISLPFFRHMPDRCNQMKRYQKTHPWLNFQLDLREASYALWMALGEACSKCEHLAGVPLLPAVARELHAIFLAKGVQATTAIEGNTLTEDQVRKRISGQLPLPLSQEYLATEVDNIVEAVNRIAKRILEGGSAHLTVDRIKEYNRLILRNLELAPAIAPGQVRTYETGVADYMGAPARDCEYLLGRLCDWLRDEAFDIPRAPEMATGIVKAILAHLYLAWIHPFGDGNGRTARLVEFDLLVSSGVPSVAAHLLSNHYNRTRQRYYQRLAEASRRPTGALSFIEYALQGFVDGLKEQLDMVRAQQLSITWRDYVHAAFGELKSAARRRQRDVLLEISKRSDPVPANDVRYLSPRVARQYEGKTRKTVTRDLNALMNMDLLEKLPEGYHAKRETILAFLPPRRSDMPSSEEGGMNSAPGTPTTPTA